MNELKLKPGIFYQGFDYENEKNEYHLKIFYSEEDYEIIYQGKTADIPEEIAKECVKSFKNNKELLDYLPDEFCIIFKK